MIAPLLKMISAFPVSAGGSVEFGCGNEDVGFSLVGDSGVDDAKLQDVMDTMNNQNTSMRKRFITHSFGFPNTIVIWEKIQVFMWQNNPIAGKPPSPLTSASATAPKRSRKSIGTIRQDSLKILSECWCRNQTSEFFKNSEVLIFYGRQGSGLKTGASTPLIASPCIKALKKSGCSSKSHVQNIQPSNP